MLTKKTFFSLLISGLILLSACKKEGFGPLTDIRPEIPVTVANVYDYRPNPTVLASKAENKITITLQIPESSGRTIKEITRVSAGATGNFSAIRDSSRVSAAGLYSNTPIAGNGTSVTFTTTFDEYRVRASTTSTPIAAPASNALLARNFYFLLKLDNGEEIYPQFVRVWVVD